MARRESKPARSETPKTGGLFLGLVIGLVIGLVVAAALAWHFNRGDGGFKPVEQAPVVQAKPQQTDLPEPKSVKAPPHAHKVHVPAKPAAAPPTPPAPPAPARKHPPAPAATDDTPSRVPLTFYGILPGDKPAKPVEPPKSSEIWWLQIAALKNPLDADKLKAKLSLLGLTVSTQQVESAGQLLYRVRVGPYKRDEDAFADLDTLSTNNYEPRLFKEPQKVGSP